MLYDKDRASGGGGTRAAKEIRLLNRVLTWSKEGVYWEPDPRHVELTLQDLQLDAGRSTPLTTPGSREDSRHKKTQGKDGPQGGVNVDVCQECGV